MRHPEHPATKIFARFAALQMLKQGKEYLLDDFFSVRNREAETDKIPQQPVSELIEESNDFLF